MESGNSRNQDGIRNVMGDCAICGISENIKFRIPDQIHLSLAEWDWLPLFLHDGRFDSCMPVPQCGIVHYKLIPQKLWSSKVLLEEYEKLCLEMKNSI